MWVRLVCLKMDSFPLFLPKQTDKWQTSVRECVCVCVMVWWVCMWGECGGEGGLVFMAGVLGGVCVGVWRGVVWEDEWADVGVGVCVWDVWMMGVCGMCVWWVCVCGGEGVCMCVRVVCVVCVGGGDVGVNECLVESLQSHSIITMSHWTSELPACFPSQGARVQIPWGVLMCNRDSPC